MDGQPPPTPKSLARELAKFAKNGLGRDLPGTQNESTVQALSDLSRELADNPLEDWPIRIARVVIREVKEIKPEMPGQLAVADVLAIGEPARADQEIIEEIEAGVPADDLGVRYQRAADRYPRLTAREFTETYRLQLLERVCGLLLKKLSRKQGDDGPPSDETVQSTKPSIMLVGGIGLLLVVIGLAWLVAAATGAIS